MRTFRSRLLSLATVFALLGVALAQSVAVYPLSAPDALLGVAVAERVADAFDEELDVIGPAATPSLVPPLSVGGGFVNPTAFLGGDLAAPHGAAVLRGALGVDHAVTGSVRAVDDGLELRLLLAGPEGVRAFTALAPADRPGLLPAKAVALLAPALGVERPALPREVDLSGPDGDEARALGLLGAGFPDEAAAALERIGDPRPRTAAVRDALAVVDDPSDPAWDPLVAAVVALNRQPLDVDAARAAVRALAEERGLPAAHVWAGALAASVQDAEAAEAAFDAAAAAYPYGRAARGAHEAAPGIPADGLDGGDGGDGGAASDAGPLPDGPALDDLEAALASGDPAALLAVQLAAELAGDPELERAALERLTRVAPTFAFPFERLSFLAFDRDDPLAAAEALAAALRLEPDSDLYWTNYGWATYLLGLLDQSEEASLRALSIDASQAIAAYNLGLARVVQGRLPEALEAYREALRFDPEVDDAAIEDLEAALERYPAEPDVHYALALLLDAEGRRAEAADQYETYLRRDPDPLDPEGVRAAIAALRRPPPPVEISEGATLRLGARGPRAEPFRPGDPVAPVFELYTPGDALPTRVDVTLRLLGPDGAELAASEAEVRIPEGAIGYVVDEAGLELPLELEPGAYALAIEADARGERLTEARLELEVGEGGPVPLRRLLGRGVRLEALDSGAALYGREDLAQPELLVRRLLSELRAAAPAADEVLPVVEEGRFAGLSGGELFERSDEQDVRDFLDFVLASGVRDAGFVFVEAYAQWALDGAPSGTE